MSGAPDIAPIAAAFPRLAALLDGMAPEPAPTTRADLLAARFGLDEFAREVIVLAAWAELEPEAAAPTIGLALAALPGAYWSAFAAEAPLRAAGLITLGEAERVTARTYALPEAVLLYLLGADGLSEELATTARDLETLVGRFTLVASSARSAATDSSSRA